MQVVKTGFLLRILRYMFAIPLQSIIDDPLAGCSPVMQQDGNGTNMLRGLLLRLRLYYSEEMANELTNQVIKECKLVSVPRWEYVINEILFEIRYKSSVYSAAYETAVLNDWTKDLMTRYPEDVVYNFFWQVKGNRDRRKR